MTPEEEYRAIQQGLNHAFAISHIAAHMAGGNKFIVQKPCDFGHSGLASLAMAQANRGSYNGTDYTSLLTTNTAILDSSRSLSWEVWCRLIDIKIFGHETAFSHIAQPKSSL